MLTALALALALVPAGPDTGARADTTRPPARIVRVAADEYRFEAPDTLPAGLTTFRFLNRGKELHHFFLVRLDGERTAAEALAAVKPNAPMPAWMHFAGGPNAPAPEGGEATASLVLRPGRYAVICGVPDAKGVPHFAHGMVKDLVVVPAAGGAGAAEALPKADLTLTLLDYGFQWSRPLTAGRHLVRVVTAPGQPHEIEIFRLREGKTLADFVRAGEQGMNEVVTAVTGVAPLAAGGENLLAVDLAPGEYVLVCFLPDAKDGKPHVAHGMVQQLGIAAPTR